MLAPNIKQQLQAYVGHVKQPVRFTGYFNDTKASQELKELATEVSKLSPLIELVLDDETYSVRRPSLQVQSVESGQSVSFAGVPMGHEFTSFVLAVLHSGGHPMKLDQDVIEQIQAIEGEYAFESFISLSCQNCPEVVQALNMMALLNPGIQHEMVDGGVFEAEVKGHNIMAVPSVYLNGESFAQGRITMQDILKKMDASGGAKQAEKIAQKAPFDSLIIGGGPAGASAAVYSARKGIRTGVIADRFGGQVQDTQGIENFISVNETTGPKLVSQLEGHVKDYDVDVMTGQRVANLSKNVESGLIDVTLENGASVSSKTAIISTGARWRELNVPGEQEYRGAGVAYCPHCDGPLFKGKRVIVVGGGNSGIEAAIDLAGLASEVTVLEFGDRLRADEVLVQKAKSLSNVQIIMNAQTTEVVGDGQKVTGLNYLDRVTKEVISLEVEGIFVQIGLIPNTDFLKGTLDLSPYGEVVTDARGETSLSGVFAAGDVTDVPYKQIIIAMGEGAKASLGAFDYLMRQG